MVFAYPNYKCFHVFLVPMFAMAMWRTPRSLQLKNCPFIPIVFFINICYTALEVIWKRGQRMKPITENTLFYGDNLFILREYIDAESVDLIYLDPPFNSNQKSYHRKIHPSSSYEWVTGLGSNSESRWNLTFRNAFRNNFRTVSVLKWERMKTEFFERETEEGARHIMRAGRTIHSRNRGNQQGVREWAFNMRHQRWLRAVNNTVTHECLGAGSCSPESAGLHWSSSPWRSSSPACRCT